MHFILLPVAIFSLLFLIIFPRYKKHAKYNYPPGPKTLPLIGNLHRFDALKPHVYLSNLSKIYGPILSLKFGWRRAVVIQSASLAKEVLKTQDNNFCSRPRLVGQQRLSYNGLDVGFGPYDEYFREIKKICVVHLFNSNKVRSSAYIRREEVSRMIHEIGCASKEINLNELLMSLTTSIISRVAFGKRYKDDVIESGRFQKLLNDAQAMSGVLFFADYFPYVGYLLDKVTGKSSKLESVFKKLDEFYDEIISDHLNPNRPKSDHEDFVKVLLQLRKLRCFSSDLTFDHIKAALMDVIVAGTDTSAIMVIWAMTQLIKNPIIMNRVQNELRSLHKDTNFIEETDLTNLEYFKAIIKETFRLHPAAPLLIVRETLHQCTLQGYDILPETLVYVNVWAIGRDPTFWKDPEVFKPERFLGSSIDFKGHNFEFIPFGAGRRVCPGMLIGVTNFELALANLLYWFDWELPVGVSSEDVDEDVIPGISMHKKNHLWLVPKKHVCET